jgi:hypothetical protein
MPSYQKQLHTLDKKERAKMKTYLSGLFTSKYGDEFMLHYVCPLCGEQVIITKKLNLKAPEITIDYQHEVTGRMGNELRTALVAHYRDDCGSNRERKEKTAQILIDKLQDGVYY